MKNSDNILKKYLLSFMPVFCISGFLMICISVLMLNKPIIIKAILEFLQNKKIPVFLSRITAVTSFDELKILFILVGLLIIFSFIQSFLIFINELFTKISTMKLERRILTDLLHHVLHLNPSYFNSVEKNKIMTVYLKGFSVIKSIIDNFLKLFSISAKIVVSVIFLFYLNYKIILLTIPLLLIIPVLVYFVKDKFKKRVSYIYSLYTEMVKVSDVILKGFRAIKNYMKENYFKKYYVMKNTEHKRSEISFVNIQVKFNSIVELITSVVRVMVLILGGYFVVKDFITIGIFLAFIMQYEVLQEEINKLSMFIYKLKIDKGVWEHIEEIFKRKEDICDSSKAYVYDLPFNTIEFKNVYLHEKDRTILKNVNFKITKGGSLGIIGNSRSGKTSILNLCEKFIKLSEGEILIDGYNIDRISSRIMRKNIRFASQNPFLFSSSIKDNINFGRDCKSIDDKDYLKIRKLLHIDSFLSYPEDHELDFGKEIKLSGGQRQRLCLARTLLIKPKMLLIDEALSGLDAWNEELVMKSILTEFEDIIKIIVTNRITTLRNLDFIIVLINGEIVECGTHDDLIAQMGFYTDFYNKQVLKMDIL